MKKKLPLRAIKSKPMVPDPIIEYKPLHEYNRYKPLDIQLALNTYAENICLIINLADQIRTECWGNKRTEQPYEIRRMAERIVYFANDLTRDFNKE